MKKAIFLDRDGTLNEDPNYLGHPDQMKLLPCAGEGLRLMMDLGFVPVVISNQSGVGRGIFPETMLGPIHARMNELLAPAGAEIRHFFCCTHRPEENCECRKPKPFLLLKAARDLGLDLAGSYMVGDKLSDLDAGRNAKVKGTILVRTGYGIHTEAGLAPGKADHVAENLLAAAKWVQKKLNQ